MEAKGTGKVAVIGAGPTGLSMLKELRAVGFDVTLFERRDKVGGLWAYTEEPAYTTALKRTEANISKYTCGFSDYPMPDHYPHHMLPQHFEEYMDGYAKHFDLHKDIVLDTTVKLVTRNKDDTGWRLELETAGEGRVVEFDKVAFCHGYQTAAVMPTWEGRDGFSGTVMHAQQYRRPDAFAGQNVVVVGLSSSAGDIVPDLAPHAGRLHVSHRRGAVVFKRWRNGTPQDLAVTWRRRRLSHLLTRHCPGLARWCADGAVGFLARRSFGALDPRWRLEPFPSVTLALPGSFEHVVPLLRSGRVESLRGIRRFAGPRALELDDGSVVEDVDAVVCCTGYRAAWDLAPWVERSTPRQQQQQQQQQQQTGDGGPGGGGGGTAAYGGAPMARLYMNVFPPAYADSAAFLTYSAFGKSNGFSFADVASMAVANVWRGAEALPPRARMERAVDAHQAWVAGRWALDAHVDESMVRQWEFQAWLHRAAGTGMENLGWGWKGWKFWWRDREMYRLMNHGVETAHAYRFFETGKRAAWDGARAAILHANEVVKVFPLKEQQDEED